MPADSVASLVKFHSADTALMLLDTQTLRWSAPALFADPFEPTHRSEPDFDGHALLEALVRQVIALLFGPEPPPVGQSRLRLTIKRWRSERRFASEGEARRVLQGLLRQLAERQFQRVEQDLDAWRQFARQVRIACFCDRVTNLNAWQHFGDQHRGVALLFDCGEGTSLGRPRRVHYGQQPPYIAQLREQLEMILDGQHLPARDSFHERLLQKGRHSRRESEWRCFRPGSQGIDTQDDGVGPAEPAKKETWYDDHGFAQQELLGVYFGLATSRDDRERLLHILGERYPATRIYQAQTVPGRYELEFTPLGAR